MNITHAKDPDRVLRNMVIGIDGIAQVKKGDRIVYHVGNFTDNIGQTKVGKMASDLRSGEFVNLCQRVICEEITEAGPLRTFEYIAEVR